MNKKSSMKILLREKWLFNSSIQNLKRLCNFLECMPLLYEDESEKQIKSKLVFAILRKEKHLSMGK